MQESLLIGNGIVFSQTLEAIQYNGYGDKIKLPPSCFNELSSQGALEKGPMCFRLSRPDAPSSVTQSGVLEFTAMEGFIELPPHVWTNLSFHLNKPQIPLVEVKYANLPKGTYAKLQPDDQGFSDLPYHKAILETTLRLHTTLSQGDIITVTHGDFSYRLRVLELKPSTSVSVIDTDVEVDIIEPEAESLLPFGTEKRPSLMPLELGKAVAGSVEEGCFNYYKFSFDEKSTSGEIMIEVGLEAEVEDGKDTDLYVSRHPIIFPTKLQHGWSCHDVGSKSLAISDPIASSYSIGVYGYRGKTDYKICVSLKQKKRERETEEVVGEQSVGMVQCKNCGRAVSEQSRLVHEAFCGRHNVVCEHKGCGAVLRKEEAGAHVHCGECGKGLRVEQLDKHLDVFHRPVHCPCGAVFNKEEMVSSNL